MASSANQGDESRTLSPLEIKFRDLENQPPPSQLQSGLSPLSPQLRYFLSRKQPTIKVLPPSSRSFPPPSSQTLALITHGSYCKVPSNWCPDRRLWTRNLYLSRNSLLKTMIHQRILYRRLEPVFHSDENDEAEMDYLGIRILGIPIDYWVTMPIHPPIIPENSDPPELEDVALNEIKGISIAFATRPVEASRYALNQLAGLGREQENDGLPFHWVRNTTGTKFTDLDPIMSGSHDIVRIIGFVECPNCKENLCIGYLMPTRIDIVNIQLGSIVEKMSKYGDKVACKFHFSCRCDGKAHSSRPIISDVLNKINWLFLFLGFGIGYCTMDQLKYYCYQRNLPISDKKNKILVTVFDDLCLQITKRRIVRG